MSPLFNSLSRFVIAFPNILKRHQKSFLFPKGTNFTPSLNRATMSLGAPSACKASPNSTTGPRAARQARLSLVFPVISKGCCKDWPSPRYIPNVAHLGMKWHSGTFYVLVSLFTSSVNFSSSSSRFRRGEETSWKEDRWGCWKIQHPRSCPNWAVCLWSPLCRLSPIRRWEPVPLKKALIRPHLKCLLVPRAPNPSLSFSNPAGADTDSDQECVCESGPWTSPQISLLGSP